VRERPHELVRWQAKASLVEDDEAHHVAITWPRLRLIPRSNPLRLVRIGDRAEETGVHQRLQLLHGDVRPLPGIRREDDRTASHCAVEDAATAVNLSLSLFQSISLALLLPGALCSQQRLGGGESKCRQGKEGRGEALYVFMQG